MCIRDRVGCDLEPESGRWFRTGQPVYTAPVSQVEPQPGWRINRHVLACAMRRIGAGLDLTNGRTGTFTRCGKHLNADNLPSGSLMDSVRFQMCELARRHPDLAIARANADDVPWPRTAPSSFVEVRFSEVIVYGRDLPLNVYLRI